MMEVVTASKHNGDLFTHGQRQSCEPSRGTST